MAETLVCFLFCPCVFAFVVAILHLQATIMYSVFLVAVVFNDTNSSKSKPKIHQ